MSGEERSFWITMGSIFLLTLAVMLGSFVSYDDGYQRGFREGAAHGWNNAEHFYGISDIQTRSRNS